VREWWTKWPDADLGLVCGNGLTVLDVDSGRATTALLSKFPELYDAVKVKTTRGYHFYHRSEKNAGKWNAEINGQRIEVKGQGSYVLAPPSWDREFDNGNPLAGLESLTKLPPYFYRPKYPDLAEKIAAAFQTYAGQAEWAEAQPLNYTDRSAAEMAGALSCVNARIPGSDILKWLRLSPKYQEQVAVDSYQQAERRIQSVLDAAHKKAKASPAKRRDGLPWIDKVERAAITCPWSGRLGSRQQVVLMALIAIARRTGGKPLFTASVREIAEGTRYATLRPISSAVRELQGLGWLRAVIRRGQISEFVLTIPKGIKDLGSEQRNVSKRAHSYPYLKSVRIDCSLIDAFSGGHDAFKKAHKGVSGLTPTALAVWTYLKNPFLGSRIVDICKATGRGRRAVSEALKRMAAWGLSAPGTDNPREWLALDVNLDTVADRIGTLGKGERQRESHRVERIRYQMIRALYRMGLTWASVRLLQMDHVSPATGRITDPTSGEVRQLSKDAERKLLEWLSVRGAGDGSLIPVIPQGRNGHRRHPHLTIRKEPPQRSTTEGEKRGVACPSTTIRKTASFILWEQLAAIPEERMAAYISPLRSPSTAMQTHG